MILRLADTEIQDPAAAWAESGAMALTGRSKRRPLLAPPGVVAGMTRMASTLNDISGVVIDGPALLGERAALSGFSRRGDVSCGGATRIMRGADGWLAVSLARPEDIDSLPAWLQTDVRVEDLPDYVRAHDIGPLVERAALLGLPAARLGEATAIKALRETSLPGVAEPVDTVDGLVVIDLSSLWAGPLCAQLLGLAGARVIKVESEARPDGARQGPSAFFDLLHSDQECVALDFRATRGRANLHRLLTGADIVIEASRPRALSQLGAGADDVLPSGRPQVWVSITGFGRPALGAGRVAFGDDAAVAGGLVVWDQDGPCFCADAIADPAAGLLAATAVVSALRLGGRWLLDVALSGVAAFLAGPFATDPFDGQTTASLNVARPRSRAPAGRAAPFGEHTSTVLRELCG